MATGVATTNRAASVACETDPEADDRRERVDALEEAVLELLAAIRGIGGVGVVARSPVARGIANKVLVARREAEQHGDD